MGTVLSDECQPNTLCSTALAYFTNSPSTNWMTTDQFLSMCYSYILSSHSELRYSRACEIASYTIPLNQIKMKQLVLQIDPYHQLVVIQQWNGFDYFLTSNCNSPGFMTVICGNHSVTPFCDKQVQNAGLQLHLFSVLWFSHIGTFFQVNFSVPTQSVLCMIFSVLARDSEL
jgi:hypothetical protein